MVDTKHPNQNYTILLKADGLSITGTQKTQPGWCEFDVLCDGVTFPGIGGLARIEFIDDMISIIKNKHGRKLGSIPDAAFKETVGGSDTEYLGYVVLSSYDTLYFFKDSTQYVHFVLADSEGRMLAHSNFDIDVFDKWLIYLERLKTQVC